MVRSKGIKSKTSVPRQPSLEMQGPKDRSPVKTESPDCLQELPPSRSLRESPGVTRGEMEYDFSSPAWSYSTAIGRQYRGIRVSHSTGRSSTR